MLILKMGFFALRAYLIRNSKARAIAAVFIMRIFKERAMIKIPRPEHPRPDRFRPEWINLNGPWQFKMDPGSSGAEQNWQNNGTAFDKEILVPFCMESSLSGIGQLDFMPAVWYRRAFSVPTEWTGKRILLHIGACDYSTRVYVNERPIFSHTGGFAARTEPASDRGPGRCAQRITACRQTVPSLSISRVFLYPDDRHLANRLAGSCAGDLYRQVPRPTRSG